MLDPEEVEKNVLEQAVNISKQMTSEFQQCEIVFKRLFVVKLLCTVTLPPTTLKTLNTLSRDVKDRLAKLQSAGDENSLLRSRLRLRQQLLQIAIHDKEEELTKKRLALLARKEAMKKKEALERENARKREHESSKQQESGKQMRVSDDRSESKPAERKLEDSPVQHSIKPKPKKRMPSHHASKNTQSDSDSLFSEESSSLEDTMCPSASSSPSASSAASCPICGVSFVSSMSLRDRTRHVDHCLSMASSTAETPPAPLSERVDVRSSHTKRRFLDDGDHQFHRSLVYAYLRWREAERSNLPAAALQQTFEEQAATLSDWSPRSIPAGTDMDAMLADYYRGEPAVRLTRWFALPRHLFAGLYEYQREGVSWLLERHVEGSGGMVADEMGLGKTLQVLALLLGMVFTREVRRRGRDWDMIPMLGPDGKAVEMEEGRERKEGEEWRMQVERSDDDDDAHRAPEMNEAQLPTLLVVPATLVGHWLREVHRWCPLLCCVLAHSMGETMSAGATPAALLRQCRKTHSYDIVMTTYEAFRSERVFTRFPWFYAILDEGGRIKNAKVGVSRQSRLLQTRHRLLISGTPLQNNLRELWSLMDFIFPGKLGTEESFVRSFVQPISRGIYANASTGAAQLGYQMSLALQDTIRPYICRRLKKVGLFVGSHEDVRKELPRKTEQVLACELTPVQARCYEAYLRGEQVQLALAGRVTPFKAIVRLRQICNHPAFFHREEAGSGGEVVLRHTDGMFFVEESVRGVGDGEEEEEDNQGRR